MRAKVVHKWRAAEIRQLGKVPDSVLAKRLGTSIRAVARGIALPTAPRRWTASKIKLIGTMSDAELARRLRREQYMVRNQRLSLRIPPFRPRAKWRYWKPHEIRMLGTIPDTEVARKLKRSLSSVQSQRLLLKLPYQASRFRSWTNFKLSTCFPEQ